MTRPRIGVCLVVAALAGAAAASQAPEPRAGGPGAFTRGALGGRAYRLYVPAAPGPRPPLVIALHGCWQTPEDFARGTRLNAAAARRGLLVLYPAQAARDHPSRCWNWFEPAHQSRTRGELAEILALVRDVRGRHPGDRAQTVAIGFSAGGFMAVNLACAAPETVAGVGVVAGGPYRCGVGAEAALECLRGARADPIASAAACGAAAPGPRPPLRASIWHGSADPVVGEANFTGLVTMFARLGAMTSGQTAPGEGAVRAIYRDARGVPMIEAWLVEGLGHAWSGGDARGTHAVAWGPSATDRILDFLLPP